MSAKSVENGTKFVWKIENFSYNSGESFRSPDFTSHSLTWRAHVYPEGCEDCPLKKGLVYVNRLGPNSKRPVGKQHTVSLQLVTPVERVFSFTFAVHDAEGFPLFWAEKQDERMNLSTNKGDRYSLSFIPQPDYSRTGSLRKVHFVLDEDILASRKSEFLPNDTLTLDICIWEKFEDLVTPTEMHAFTQLAPEIVTINKSFDWQIPGISSFSYGLVEEYKSDFMDKIFTANLSISKSGNLSLNLSVPFYGNINCKVFFYDTRGQMKPIGDIKSKISPGVDCADIDLKLTKSVLMSYRSQFLFNDSLKLHLECEVASKINFSFLGSLKKKLELNKKI